MLTVLTTPVHAQTSCKCPSSVTECNVTNLEPSTCPGLFNSATGELDADLHMVPTTEPSPHWIANFTGVKHVTGMVFSEDYFNPFSGAARLKALHMPDLATTGGDINLFTSNNLPLLEEVDLSKYNPSSGNKIAPRPCSSFPCTGISITWPKLRVLKLNAFTNVGGGWGNAYSSGGSDGATFNNNPSLTDVYFSSLPKVELVKFTNNPKLVNIDLSSLKTIGGDTSNEGQGASH